LQECNGKLHCLSLPYKRDEAIAHALCVLLIAGKLAAQDLLFTCDPLHHEKRVAEEDSEGDERAQDERHGEEDDDGSAVHRVAHDTVYAAVDERLAALHLDSAREVLVLSQYHGPQDISCKKETRSGPDHPGGYPYPLKAEVEAGADKAQEEDHVTQPGHRLLLLLLLLRRKAPRKEGWILEEQHNAGDGHRNEEQGEEEPPVWVVQRPGGDEQQQGDHYPCREKLHQCLACHMGLHAVLRVRRRD
jgi:hypothetical protein